MIHRDSHGIEDLSNSSSANQMLLRHTVNEQI